MKKLILGMIAIISLSTSASFYQDFCSNAEGTVEITSGHVSNHILLTERVYGKGKVSENKIEFDRFEMDIQFGEVTSLKETSSKNCKNGSGIAQWESIFAKEVTLSNKDGSLFDKNISGVSRDQKTVSAYLICKHSGNSMIICN